VGGGGALRCNEVGVGGVLRSNEVDVGDLHSGPTKTVETVGGCVLRSNEVGGEIYTQVRRSSSVGVKHYKLAKWKHGLEKGC